MTQVSQSSQKVPKLRFREFQSEWIKKTMGDFTKVNQGLQIPISDRFTEQVENSFFYITNEFLKVGNQKKYYIKNPSSSVLCNEDDILMTRTGNTGKIVTGVNGAFHNNFFKIQYSKSDYDRIFLCEFLGLDKTQSEILKVAGTSTIPDLNHSDFYKLKIHLPSLPEQQKIASFLSSVDTRIEQLREKKSLLEEYKKGVMQQIFAREIRFKDENGEEYGGWEEKKLGDLCKIKTGKKDVNEGNPEGQYPFFTCAKSHTYSDFYSFDCDAILIAGNGEVGHCQRYSGKFEAYQRTYVLSDFSEDINYLYCHLNSTFQDVISSQKQMGAMPYIKLGMLTDFMIPIPSLPEQIKIASFLSEIDSKIQSTTEQLEEALKWKKGLLQGMFV